MARFLLVGCIALSLAAVIALAHGGGLDSKGGHFNRKTGEYHTHRPASSSATSVPVRTEARDVLLTTARTGYRDRSTLVAAESFKIDLHAQEEARKRAAHDAELARLKAEAGR